MYITFSGNLRRFVGFQKKVLVESTTVAEGIQNLVRAYPHIRPVIMDADGCVRKVHRLFLNNELLDSDQLQQISSQSDDELLILTALAGG